MDWLDVLRKLDGADRVFVRHEPTTPRYVRAGQKLTYVLRDAVVLGTHPGEQPGTIEVAAWARSPTGKGSGFYCCFRIEFEDSTPVEATLFCFYDGTEGSVTTKTHEAAEALARANNFEKVQ
jgi:hypothetical protein